MAESSQQENAARDAKEKKVETGPGRSQYCVRFKPTRKQLRTTASNHRVGEKETQSEKL